MELRKGITMKKLITLLLVGILATPAFAGGHGHFHRTGGGWVPLIVGGVAGYAIAQAQNNPVVVQQPTVVVTSYPPAVPVQTIPQSQQVPQQQYCESTQVVDQFGVARLIQYCYYR